MAASPWYNGFDLFLHQKVVRTEKLATADSSYFSFSKVPPAILQVGGEALCIICYIPALIDSFILGV